MMTWKNRIELIKSTFGIRNNKQLELALGLSNGYINDLIGGIKNKNPSKIIVALTEKYKISPAWFFDDDVGMFGEKQENVIRRESELILAIRRVENSNEGRFLEIETRLTALESLMKPAPETAGSDDGPMDVAELEPAYGEEEEEEEYEDTPYFNKIAAGPPAEIDGDRSEMVRVPSRLLKRGERYYAAKIQGDSMIGAGILNGELVLIRYADVPRDGAIQAVRYQDKVTLKRLREVEGKGWELRYMDGSGKVIICDTDEYETLGEFVTVLPKNTALRER